MFCRIFEQYSENELKQGNKRKMAREDWKVIAILKTEAAYMDGINCIDPKWTIECVLYGWKAMDDYFPQNFTVHEDLFSGEKYSNLNRQTICQKSVNFPTISPLWKAAIFDPLETVWATILRFKPYESSFQCF